MPETETPLNKALASVSARTEAINAPTRSVWNPWECPAEFLKVLAHAFSVDLWDDAWTESAKRSIIANAVTMHRSKGTLAGIEAYLSYTQGALKRVTTLPQRVFSGPSLGREAREAWLRSLPQVRIWKAVERGEAGRGVYVRRLQARAFFLPNAAPKRREWRARWVENGVDTTIRVSEYGSYFRLHRQGKAGRGAYAGRKMARCYLLPSTAATRLYTIAPQSSLPWRGAAGPSLTAIKSEPERVKERGTAGRGSYVGRSIARVFFLPSSAWRRIYDCFPVVDGRRAPSPRSIQFMGLGRYSFPAHTARLRLSVPGTLPRWAAGKTKVSARPRFWAPTDAKRNRDVRDALLAAKRASDRLLVEHVGGPTLIAGGSPFLASIDNFVIGFPGRRA